MKSKLSMILFILILGSTLTTALVSVDNFTREPIARNKAKKLQKSILSLLGFAYTKDSLSESFSENIKTHKLAEVTFYQAKTSGYLAFEIHGMGLWGPIHGTIALTPNLQKIHGISIIHQEETPGLGEESPKPNSWTALRVKILPKVLLFSHRARPWPIMKWTE